MLVTSLTLEADALSSADAQLVLKVGTSVSVQQVPLNGSYTPGGPINVTSADLAAAMVALAAALPAIVKKM